VFEVVYDNGAIDMDAFEVADALAGATVAMSRTDLAGGRVRLTFTLGFTEALAAGTVEIGSLIGKTRSGADYGSDGFIRVALTEINGTPVDEGGYRGLHLAAYRGDYDLDGDIDAIDAALR
ncbi:MAG: hypothetical protein KDJ77_03465, partial [Rhodobiaceae bacterium]|nr:hypothetical protein [Rhodobiaceae bacterium]